MDVLAHPGNRAGRDALCMYREVLRAVAGDAVVFRSVVLEGQVLRISEVSVDLGEYRRVYVIGAGKASAAMASALEIILGERLHAGIVVTKYGHTLPAKRIRMLEAGHPVPDRNSVEAGRAIAEAAQSLGQHDLVLVVLSGGASALMELPAPGVTLEDMQRVTDLLLRCGANINEVNAIRCRLSRIKAGGLARLLAPARVVCLVLSDVLGNPLHVIGSGPCWADSSALPDPIPIVERYGLTAELPPSVMHALKEQAKPRGADVPPSASADHVIVGDISTATRAAADTARQLGYHPLVLTTAMQGEAREIGTLIGAMCRDLPTLPQQGGVNCLILAGEPTVTVRGDGVGGRCMELACAAALRMEDVQEIALLAAGTDGTDGPTDAAGALTDGATARLAREAGYPLDVALVQSDTYHALDRAGALVRTGPTGSNVGDVVIALFSP